MTELGGAHLWPFLRAGDEPGRMIIIQYSGGKKSDAPIALVGKGITLTPVVFPSSHRPAWTK